MGSLIDPKSDSAVTRIVQQIDFLGLQILDKGRLYSRTLAEDLSKHFLGNYPFPEQYPSEIFGLIRGCLFHGLDPYQEMVHSIASWEVMVRSSRGLTEPGTLFKNLMAILRDVVICYDGTVRNVCSNSIIHFEYGYRHRICLRLVNRWEYWWQPPYRTPHRRRFWILPRIATLHGI
ncbi:hypothetical protein L2E82_40293 [Cichorium intybus]|uniref:Uncharacterized protein n=1 Tax=Cichorium intybus TaxID=13427 RepID=A0ACB9AKQ6_CICIN|nr:hypothetical protein L2E82_40293 [Cichorium intybus]